MTHDRHRGVEQKCELKLFNMNKETMKNNPATCLYQFYAKNQDFRRNIS